MGGDLEEQDHPQQNETPEQQGAAQKAEEVGEVHGVPGEEVDAAGAEALGSGTGEVPEGEGAQAQPGEVEEGPRDQGPPLRPDRAEEGEEKESGGGELVDPVGQPLQPVHGGKAGGPTQRGGVQLGQQPEPEEQKGKQQKKDRHGGTSLSSRTGKGRVSPVSHAHQAGWKTV